jgi:hypothetical protein
MQDYLSRYYELDQLKKMIEAELEKMKRVLLAAFPEPVDRQFGPYHLKIYLQDRGAFDLQRIYSLLPSDDMRLFVSNPNNSNIKDLIKQGILEHDQAQETYSSKPVAIISVKEGSK